MSDPAAIHVEDLTKVYSRAFGREGVRALNEVTLSVAPGELFGLLGPNGAGKTTLVKILLSIVWPTKGRAALFGREVKDPAARQRVGYLPEQHRFPDRLTAEGVLNLYGQLGGVPADQRRERIPRLLEQVDLSSARNDKVGTFSKGMRQRLGLAQALLNDPDLLFLDEPTDGVDPVGRRAIRDLLQELHREGKTIFLNSHLLSEVEQICTRVAILREGQVVRRGTIEELTAVERVYELTCTPLSESMQDEHGDVIRPAPNPPRETSLARYRLMVEDRSHLNALLDRLRQAGIQLEAITPLRRTLEDYFIEVVGSEAATEADRASD